LGLAICKELIQLHQGKIGVTSKRQEGSTFYFTIPQGFDKRTKSEDSVLGTEKLLKLKNPTEQTTVLVVEDNREILTVISVMLRKFYTVFEAESGEEGLALAIKYRPDLIISDIYMPTMDGIELCQHIKGTPATFHIPVILLTALDSEDSKIKSFDTGADAYVTKPFNEALLISQIQNLISSRKKLKQEFTSLDFLGEVQTKEKATDEFIQKCVEIIHSRGSEANFTLDQLAEGMNMSRSSLYRKIKETTGMKAIDFLKKAKLHFAAKLLLNTDLTVSEVAFECGYNDPKYFSRCFAKEYGNLPSEFKKYVL
jgi:YesN/AraC family two-component response regulator